MTSPTVGAPAPRYLLENVVIPEGMTKSETIDFLMAQVWGLILSSKTDEVDEIIDEMKLEHEITKAKNDAYAILSKIVKHVGSQDGGTIAKAMEKEPWLEIELNDALKKVGRLEMKRPQDDNKNVETIAQELFPTTGMTTGKWGKFSDWEGYQNLLKEKPPDLTADERNAIAGLGDDGKSWLAQYDATASFDYATDMTSHNVTQAIPSLAAKTDKFFVVGGDQYKSLQVGSPDRILCDVRNRVVTIGRFEQKVTTLWNQWKGSQEPYKGGVSRAVTVADLNEASQRLQASISADSSNAQLKMIDLQKRQGEMNTASTAYSSELKKLSEAKEKGLR